MKKILFFLITFFIHYISNAQHTQIEFVENQGQWEGDFLYQSITPNGEIFLQKDGIIFQFTEASGKDLMHQYHHGFIKDSFVIKHHAYKMKFLNAEKHPKLVGSRPQSYYNNYFLGNDSTKWKAMIYPMKNIDYQQLYPGIDMHIYSQESNLKYDLIVEPNADVSKVQFQYDGVEKLKVNKNGNLVITTSIGNLEEMKPIAYQVIDNERIPVPCNYTLHKNILSFDFPNSYNKAHTLVIDPIIVFCTFTGSTADNWGFTATYDLAGNAYTGGLVSGAGFPVSLGAFQSTYGGGSGTTGGRIVSDIAIMKINTTGSTKIYATYIGGSNNDQPHSMIVDTDNNLIIAGRTYSTNYPTTSTAFDRSHNGDADIIITKLNATGSALIGSTYVGGSDADGINVSPDFSILGNSAGLKHNYGDDARSEVNVDKSGNIYLTSSTVSTDFPTQNPIQTSLAGGQDAIVLKMNSTLSNLLFSSYVGGSKNDAGYVLILSNDERSFYIGGGTESNNFPVTTGTFQPTFGGVIDGYALKFSNGPSFTLQKGTYVGMNAYDQVYGIAVDMSDNFYLMGQTLGGNFPVTPGTFNNPRSSQFVMKLDGDLTNMLFSTVYGTGNSTETNISPVAFLVDTCENIYISGWGGLLNSAAGNGIGSTTGMPITPSASMSTTDGSDFYFIVLSPNASSLLYATFFGRRSTDLVKGEHVDGGTSRFDKDGIVYQAMCAGCGGSMFSTPFPTTAGSLSPTNGSSNCNLAVVKIAFELGATIASADVTPKTVGCPPFTVNFINNSVNAKTYKWDFDDGGATSTSATPSYTFTKPGKYRIRLIAENPDACTKLDTAYVEVIVDDNSIKSDFEYTITDSCNLPYKVEFENTSTYGKSGAANFIWNFGDGTALFNGAIPPVHEYNRTGTFTVTLVMMDPAACNNPDTMIKVITIENNLVKAKLDLPDMICRKTRGIEIFNASTNYTSVFWDFGDGHTSTSSHPTHVFDTGTFEITLIVYNTSACNKSDTIKHKITVKPGATADFDFFPKIPIENDSIRFSNKSTNALSYLWQFGDGKESSEVHPTHMYRKTGKYTACLIARGFESCNDTVCKQVDALIIPAIDVPTAFSPNGDHKNDVLYVRGAAIESIEFYIYNRWGELVFQSNSIEVGWDGTYKGQPQPMETYAYVLNAVFINGESETKRGNITIIE